MSEMGQFRLAKHSFPLAAPFAVLGSIAAEFHQARLFGVQFKMEPLESLPEFLQESLGGPRGTGILP